MKKSIFTISLCFLLLLFFSLIESRHTYAQTDIPAGNVSGTWTKSNSPYHIEGEITIPNDSTLTIEPGVEVVFTGHYKFNVQGRLLAIGTETDTIVFTINDTTGFYNVNIPDGGWSGIRFMNTPSNNDSSKIVYCKLQFGKANTGVGENYDMLGGAICAVINKLLVSHCLFRNNTTFHPDVMLTGGGCIFIEGNPTVEFCEFTENTSSFGSAICVWGSNIHPLIRNNYFHHNGGHGTIDIGSLNGSNTSPVLINNIFAYNHSTGHTSNPDGHGIVHFSNGGGKAVLINNTIVNNSCDGPGGAIFTSYYSATPLLINNTIYGNTPAQVRLNVTNGLDFYNCLIEGGLEGFSGSVFTGDYENCIDVDPLFVSSNDFHLQDRSNCIGVAIDSVLIDGTWYYCPPNDFDENPRPNPIGSMPDMGAYENPLALPEPTEIPAGDVSGTWTKAFSPYHINGEITIPNDSTLTIEPGVKVVFTGHYKFNVQGRLLAIGTEADTIVFTINDTTGFHNFNFDGAWGGIELRDIASSNDSSIIEYCIFQYGKTGNGGAIHCRLVDKLRISHCLFRNNVCFEANPFGGAGGAIYIAHGKPVIEYCEFYSNIAEFIGSALYIVYSDAIIRNNHFHHNLNSATIRIDESAVRFINNLIEQNHSTDYGGILFLRNDSDSVNAVIINNTIANNICAQGAVIPYGSSTSFINNIIYGNEPSQVYFYVTSSAGFYNCLIEGGQEGFTGEVFTGAYENCIDVDPLFVSSNDYHLQNTSFCIGAAIDSIQIGALWFYCPPNDFEGNPRPNPSGSMPDIGAFESPLANPDPVGVEENLNSHPTEYALSQNYPNPFNPTTTIKYSVPELSFVTIKIYDVLGSEVATLINEEEPAGTYELNWNANNISSGVSAKGGYASGVYLYRLQAGNYVETKKMILIK
jgi:hypothetical protein